MSGQDGIEATRQITAWPEPRPRVLVLTTFDLDEIVHDALEAGADGFLLKRTTPEELVEGIRTVAAGEALISGALTRRLLAHVARRKPTDASSSLVVPLTAREAEVLRYLTEGLSNAEIAAELAIGHETVKTHLKRICMKTGTRRPHAGGRVGLPERIRHRELISRDPDRCTPSSLSCGDASRGHRHLGLEDALALVVGEAAVDHLVRRLGQARRASSRPARSPSPGPSRAGAGR